MGSERMVFPNRRRARGAFGRRAARALLAAMLAGSLCVPTPALAWAAEQARGDGSLAAGGAAAPVERGDAGETGADVSVPDELDAGAMAEGELLVVLEDASEVKRDLVGAAAALPARAAAGRLDGARGLSARVALVSKAARVAAIAQDAADEPAEAFIQAAEAADAVEGGSLEAVIDGKGSLDAVVKAEVPQGASARGYAEQLAELPGVARVQPNFRYQLVDDAPALEEGAARTADAVRQAREAASLGAQAAVASEFADDPYLWREYYLADYETHYGANVLEAWKAARTNYAVTVAVLDTGCRVGHVDLAANIDTANMWDAYTGTVRGRIASSEVPYGDNIGHGTHVCGIVGAQANNGLGVAGSSYNATVLPIKVFDNNYDPYCYSETSDIIKAYDYLFNLVDAGEVDNLHVINMSLGGYETEETDAEFKAAIAKARDDYQIISVCAGGNGNSDGTPNTDPCYPSDFDESFSVTALDTNGYNVMWSDYNRYKDISAPGVSIYSTYYGNDSDYDSLSGTSMASPLVAGIFSLLWAYDPQLTVEEAREAVCDTAKEVRTDGGVVRDRRLASGSAGAIDAAAAVAYVGEHFGNGTPRTPLADAGATVAAIPMQFHTGRELEPAVQVSLPDGTALESEADYRVAYSDNVKVGTASVSITGRGSYSGRLNATFDIFYDMNDATVSGVAASYAFTGEGMVVEPVPRVTYHGRQMNANRDYTYAYSDNDAPGTGHVVFTGMGDYRGTKDVTFQITTIGLAGATVLGLRDSYAFSGAKVEPAFDVLCDGRLLAEGWDYYTVFEGNDAPGTAKATIVGMNEFSGQTTRTFRLTQPLGQVSVTLSASELTYNGKVQVPAVTGVVAGGAALRAGADYTVRYSDAASRDVGSYAVTVTGAGGYTGQATVRYSIGKAPNPISAKARTPQVKAGKSVAASKVAKVSGAQGKVTYKKTGGNAKISIASNGKLKVKKGLRKGSYPVKLKVSASGDANYLKASKQLTVRVKVK